MLSKARQCSGQIHCYAKLVKAVIVAYSPAQLYMHYLRVGVDGERMSSPCCQASERRCADAAASYLQRLANSSDSGGSGGAQPLLAAAAAADALLQVNVLAAPRSGGGTGYLQQCVASVLYGEDHLLNFRAAG
jgi:hypothetical protein